jgi:hypothetical protein
MYVIIDMLLPVFSLMHMTTDVSGCYARRFYLQEALRFVIDAKRLLYSCNALKQLRLWSPHVRLPSNDKGIPLNLVSIAIFVMRIHTIYSGNILAQRFLVVVRRLFNLH